MQALACGPRGVNEADVHPLAVSFDVYGPDYSIHSGDTIKRQDILNPLVDEALARDGWALRELNGVEDASWESVPLAEYQRHLDYIASLVAAGRLRVAGPTEIIRYRAAVGACGIPVVTDGRMTFASTSADCVAADSPVSVVVSVENQVSALVAQQAGRDLKVRQLFPVRFVVDVLPSAGPAELSGR